MTTEHSQSENTTDTNIPQKNTTFFGTLKKFPRTSILIFVLFIVAGVFTWQYLSHKKDLRLAQFQYIQNSNAMRHEMLLLLAKPMVWSLRTEMLRGNMDQVQFLINDMVQDGNFIFIHVIDPKGIVIATTDISIQGKPIGTDICEHSLTAEQPICEPDGDTRVLVSAPVMGVDRKMATLVFAYTVINP